MREFVHAYMHTFVHAYMHTCIHAYLHSQARGRGPPLRWGGPRAWREAASHPLRGAPAAATRWPAAGA
eukprot:11222380-Lingulodinium_polyedra.AAC.1